MGETGGNGEFEAEFRTMFLTAYRVAYRVLGDITEAEDAAAEALARTLRAWRRVGSLPHRNAWVSRVAANVAIDRVRRSVAGRRAPEVEDERDFADLATLRIALQAALVTLPRRQRQVMTLKYLGGFSEADVASSLGVSINSVKKHTQRAIAALRDNLGPDWQEAGCVLE